jgi:hypothetical protein
MKGHLVEGCTPKSMAGDAGKHRHRSRGQSQVFAPFRLERSGLIRAFGKGGKKACRLTATHVGYPALVRLTPPRPASAVAANRGPVCLAE